MMRIPLLSALAGVFSSQSQGADILSDASLYRPGKLKPFAPPVRESRSEAKRRRYETRHSYRQPAAKHIAGSALRRLRWARLIANAVPSFHPLGSPLTLKVSKGLRWGHMSRERRIRLSNLAARKSAA